MNGQDAIRDFIRRLADLHEPEFGDFKRKAELYLSQMAEEITDGSPAQTVLRDMRRHLIYNPNGHVETTRQFLLKKSRELLGGGV